MKLNPEQAAVVESDAATILCEACPGSGKTQVLVERIARLIESGVHPGKMVCITFTNAAAAEMSQRLARRMGWVEARHARTSALGYCGTLHSFMLRVIRRWGGPELAGFSVIDTEQAKELLAEAVKETRYTGSLAALVKAVEDFDLTARRKTMSKEEVAAAAFYFSLFKDNVLTFDMLLARGLEVLAQTPGWPYEWLFVDEFQDSGKLDGRIYEAMPVKNRFYVGDERQAIYGFRGVNASCLTAMRSRPGVATFSLRTNYRSASAICGAANRLLADLPPIEPATADKGDVTLQSSPTAERELVHVAEWLRENGHAEAAVLVRTNALVAEWSAGLVNMGIPVRKRTAQSFPFDWPKAKAFLSLLANPNNDRLAFRAIKLSQGEQTALAVKRSALEHFKTINDLALHLPDNLNLNDALLRLAKMGVSAESIELVRLTAESMEEPAIEDVLFALASDTPAQEDGAGVFVATIHGAKGREWHTVVLPSFEQETIPRTNATPEDVAENRRIAYVGVTRAKRRLLISYAESRRTKYSTREHVPATPSQFIREMGLRKE